VSYECIRRQWSCHAGEIEKAHEALRRMVLDLENLDATILLLQFEPDLRVESIAPKAFRPPQDWSNRGEMTRICLSILRQATEPLTTRDIALQLFIERALNRDDQKLLRLQRDKGKVICDPGPGRYDLWPLPHRSRSDT
jgi:hypothetical protein